MYSNWPAAPPPRPRPLRPPVSRAGLPATPAAAAPAGELSDSNTLPLLLSDSDSNTRSNCGAAGARRLRPCASPMRGGKEKEPKEPPAWLALALALMLRVEV